MPVLDLTNSYNTYILELTNHVTNTTVELNASLLPASSSLNLEDLLNVNAGATSGNVIVYDGSNWIPGTATATFPTATANQILQYNGTEWVAVDLSSTGGSGDDTTDADINVTDAAGNYVPGMTIAAGTDFESIFRTMLESYQQPVMSLSGWTSGTFEHGESYSDTTFTLAFTNDSNIDTGDNGTYVTEDTYLTGGTGTAFPFDGPYTIPALSGTLLVTDTNEGTGAVQRTNAAKITVSGFSDTNGDSIAARSASSTVRYRYWIVDYATQLTPDSISTSEGATMMSGRLSGGNSIESALFSSDSQLGFTASGNHDYIYWVFPAAAEISNVVMNGSINLYAGDKADKTTAVIHMGEFDLVNQHGRTVRMEVLRSKVNNAFASGSVITVS
jgi:hypothetical protein